MPEKLLLAGSTSEPPYFPGTTPLEISFGKPQYNNVYSYNAESFNPNMDAQYLRARYYSVKTAGFISEESYLGDISDPLTLNRYNYVKSSPLNYIDPSITRF